MKISTRKSTVTGISVGVGSYQLNCTEDQLKIIASLLYTCRLGIQGFPNAASALGEAIEIAMDEDGDFAQRSFDETRPYITVTDAQGNELHSLLPDNYPIDLE